MNTATAREYVRLCPVCGVTSPPQLALCSSCGTLLLGVDLSLRQAAAPPASPEQIAAVVPPPAAALRCAYADCGAENPPDSTSCLYCGRPLENAVVAVTPAPTLTSLYRLPAALAEKFHILEVLPAGGAEAEIMILGGVTADVKVIAKLYRPGLAPNTEVLERVSQAAFRHVVHLIAHGVSDGIGYELMEYCPAGSLRQLMAEGPQPRERLRLIVTELNDALSALHDLHVIHRDLKPENVLVRRREPLDLVLTDFGIASLNDATQRFTGLARTVKYGAPETLSGVLDRAADYWSLGMILLELLTGRHPFDGLSDAVITHRLVTGHIDSGAVSEADWATLCRGLLLRDPQRRWGSAEIRRWLAGDSALVVPQERAPPARPQAQAARPYRLEEAVCWTPLELAAALATYWQAGRKDLMRGQITAWAGQDLQDHNLVRLLQDLLETRDISDDLRLLRLIRHLAPELPPSWRGVSLAAANLLAQAARAEQGDATAAAWLVAVFGEKVLRELPAAQYPAEAALVARWEAGRERFGRLWGETEQVRSRWRQDQTSIDGVADFDALVYGEPEALAAPAPARLHPLLLLALADETHAAQLHARIQVDTLAHLEHSPWLARLLDDADAVSWVVARFMAPHAQSAADDAQRRQQRELDAVTAQRAALATRANEALARLRETCDLGLFAGEFERGVASTNIQALLALLEEARAAGLAAELPLLRTLARAEPIVLRIQDRLDAWENAARINALWRNRNLLQGVGGIFFFAVIFANETLPNQLPLWILLILGAIIAWRLRGLAALRNAIRTLSRSLPLRVPSMPLPP